MPRAEVHIPHTHERIHAHIIHGVSMTRIRFTVLLLALALAPSAVSTAALTDYLFAVRSGAALDTTGATTIWASAPGSGGITNQVVSIALPFPFDLDYQTYTQASVSSNGVVGFGVPNVTNSANNRLATTATPIIAPWWDQLRIAGGAGCWSARVSHVTIGLAPNRIFVIDFSNVEIVRIIGAPTRGSFQVRLHETTNRVELWYGRMTPCDDCLGSGLCANTSASIGLARGAGNFISVRPNADTATISTTVALDSINLNGVHSIDSATIYQFTPGFRRLELWSSFNPVGPSSPLFAQTFSCAGDVAMSVPLSIHNPGTLAMTVRSIDLYRLDTLFQQGTPSLHLLRDAQARPIATQDYVVTATPGGAPMPVNTPLSTPIVVAPGATQTVYVTFVGQEPGRRYARMFVRTDASGVSGIDTNYFGPGVPQTITSGLVAVDLLGEALGAWLAATPEGAKIRTVVFQDTRAGDTSYAELIIANAGACDLRINRSRMRIFSGDVNEFAIVSRFRHTTYDVATGDDVLGIGQSDTMVFRFTPVRSGTRLATLFMQTNDSTLGVPGLVERGSKYIDLFGRGRAGLDARPLVLNTVIVGSFVNGVVTLENSSIAAVDIASITFSGGDSAEFAEDASNPWPTGNIRVLGGGVLRLGVRMTPTGQPGVRRTTMVIVTTTGDSARVAIQGEAGTAQLVIGPSTLFENVTVPVGGSVRRTIVISNVGTLPVRLQMPVLSGVDAGNYRLGPLPRLDLEPGQTEFLEVTFAPTASGQSSAEIRFSSNAGPDQIVTLGGDALRVRGNDDPTLTGGTIGGGSTPIDAASAPVTGRPRPVNDGGSSLR